ncbi:hypothetical protein [Haliangium ochraceum]|uniref:Uncharacterized protein n=1 Tax=Haliangium ochraceum (strain DSM 14365 / JCM 11303 / SMP-2) TaxID=502025 RepID=D0LS98_HALO1|nr:hypothetical protein [Haliangium ochraceum]ACY15597.1 hypothetical protein Hoch_3092 [Haliangium ochraceum DSM 14365]
MSVGANSGDSQSRSALRGTALLLLLCGAGACVHRLPPALTPQPVVPAITAAPPAQGDGRLVIDVVQGPAPVHEVQMQAEPIEDASGYVRYGFHAAPEMLCPASPCVVDAPPGNILLGFPVIGDPGAIEVELVHISEQPTIYRRALSEYDGETGAVRVLGILGTSVGGAALTTGIPLLTIGLANENRGLGIAGAASMAAGTALLTLGIWAIRADSPSFRPGSSLHFDWP